jgi:hypothetical protein
MIIREQNFISNDQNISGKKFWFLSFADDGCVWWHLYFCLLMLCVMTFTFLFVVVVVCDDIYIFVCCCCCVMTFICLFVVVVTTVTLENIGWLNFNFLEAEGKVKKDFLYPFTTPDLLIRICHCCQSIHCTTTALTSSSNQSTLQHFTT